MYDFLCYDPGQCGTYMAYFMTTTLDSNFLNYQGLLGLSQPDASPLFATEKSEFESWENMRSILDTTYAKSFSTRFSSSNADSWIDLMDEDPDENESYPAKIIVLDDLFWSAPM